MGCYPFLLHELRPTMADFYCDEVLSGKVLAFHHTKPYYTTHIVVIPKKHISSLLDMVDNDRGLLIEMMGVIRRVAAQVLDQHEGCRVITNLGSYQDSGHLYWHVVSGERLQRQPV